MACGLLLGFSYFCYFYFFSYLLCLGVIMLGLTIIFKRKDLFKRMGVILFFSLPFVIIFFKKEVISRLLLFTQSSNTEKLPQTISDGSKYFLSSKNLGTGINMRMLIGGLDQWVSLILTGALIWLIIKYRNRSWQMLCALAFVITNIVVMNQQLITGVVVQPVHYRLIIIPLGVTIALILILTHGKIPRPQWLNTGKIKVISILLLTMIFMEAFVYQFASYAKSSLYYAPFIEYGETFNWLERKSEAEDRDFVVMAEMHKISILSTIYAGQHNYFNFHTVHEMYSSRFLNEYHNRLYGYLAVAGFSPADFRAALIGDGEKEGPLFYHVFGFRHIYPERNKADPLTHNQLPLVTDEELDKAVETYSRFIILHHRPILYKLDYLLYGPEEKNVFKKSPAENPDFVKIYTAGEVEIYSWKARP